jgi:NAD(P)-dependent dehydrogenase (short-subunit alcohol dehydrogenase family)
MSWYRGKWALVTGVGRNNMGESIALALSSKGMHVILVGHTDSKVKAAAKRVKESGNGEPIWRAFDFSIMSSGGPQSYSGFVEDIKKTVKEIHVLVHAAGFAREAGFLETDEQLFDTTFAINLKTPFFLTKECIQSGWMREGVIITISSTVGEPTHGWSGGMVYSMSKAAVTLWGQMLAEVSAPSIRVNTVLPGSIDTPMADFLLGEGGKRKMACSVPLRRLGKCDEISSVVLELVANEYLSGTEVRVDGARTVGG